MTNAQRISLRISQVRKRLSEIASIEGDEFTDEVRAESGGLESEFSDLEARHRAALIAEGDEQAEKRGEFGGGDGETAERRRLLGAVTIAAPLPGSSKPVAASQARRRCGADL